MSAVRDRPPNNFPRGVVAKPCLNAQRCRGLCNWFWVRPGFLALGCCCRCTPGEGSPAASKCRGRAAKRGAGGTASPAGEAAEHYEAEGALGKGWGAVVVGGPKPANVVPNPPPDFGVH